MTWQKCKVKWPIKWSREEGCQLTWVLCSWWSPGCGCLCTPHRTLGSRSEHQLLGRRHQLQTLGQWLNCIPECQLWIFLPSSLLSTCLPLSLKWPRRDMKMIFNTLLGISTNILGIHSTVPSSRHPRHCTGTWQSPACSPQAAPPGRSCLELQRSIGFHNHQSINFKALVSVIVKTDGSFAALILLDTREAEITLQMEGPQPRSSTAGSRSGGSSRGASSVNTVCRNLAQSGLTPWAQAFR